MTATIDIDALPSFDWGMGRTLLRYFKDEYASNSVDPNTVVGLGHEFFLHSEYGAAACVLDFGVENFPDDHGLLNARANLLARCPDSTYLNGTQAIEDAKRALYVARDDGSFEGRPYVECRYLETLAAGYVVAGDTASATATLLRAISLAKTRTLRKKLSASLAEVESGQPRLTTVWEKTGVTIANRED